jgi:TonB family protein
MKRKKRGPGGPRDSRPGGQRYGLLRLRRGGATLYYHADMRNTTFVQPLSFRFSLFCLLAICFFGLPAFAQDAAPAASPVKDAPAATPTDPKELMLMAAKTNGLIGEGMKPWHLKVSFNFYDEKGNSTDQGTFEEYWAGEHKHKIAYTSKAYSQIEFETDNGILLTGMPEAVPYSLAQIQTEFIHPIKLDEKLSKHSEFKMQTINLSGKIMHCLTEIGHNDVAPQPIFVGPAYCLETDQSSLRTVTSVRWPPGISIPESVFTFDNILSFQGHYIARDVESFLDKKLVFKAHLDNLDELKTVNESDFAPLPGNSHIIRRIDVPEEVARKLLLQHPKPVSPPLAQIARIYGDVVIHAIIGADGRILSLHVLSGPAMLQQAALNAVKQWTYKPYILNGEAVQISTTIKVSL